MKKRDDSVFLRHILDSIAIIESYLSEITAKNDLPPLTSKISEILSAIQ